MKIAVVSLFPNMFLALQEGVIGRAIKKNQLMLSIWNPRDFVSNKQKQVDDHPYGGGAGMILKAEPLYQAISAAKCALGETALSIYLSPQGITVNQSLLNSIANKAQSIIMIAGRYKGIDERVISLQVDEEWSIGDIILSGGELAAMLIIDALARLIPGVLGDEQSAKEDSFMNGLLDCPYFTRPVLFNGLSVPSVLLTGNHQSITRWRLKHALGNTWLKRPDLLVKKTLTELERELLIEFKTEYDRSKT